MDEIWKVMQEIKESMKKFHRIMLSNFDLLFRDFLSGGPCLARMAEKTAKPGLCNFMQNEKLTVPGKICRKRI